MPLKLAKLNMACVEKEINKKLKKKEMLIEYNIREKQKSKSLANKISKKIIRFSKNIKII